MTEQIAEKFDADGRLTSGYLHLLVGGTVYTTDPITRGIAAELIAARTELAAVAQHIDERPEFVATLRDYRGGDDADYHRWTGHAEARGVLATRLGWTKPHEPGEHTRTTLELAADWVRDTGEMLGKFLGVPDLGAELAASLGPALGEFYAKSLPDHVAAEEASAAAELDRHAIEAADIVLAEHAAEEARRDE